MSARPIWDLHWALSNLLELSERLMAETGRKPAPDGAISRAKTALQIHEQAASDQLRASVAHGELPSAPEKSSDVQAPRGSQGE